MLISYKYLYILIYVFKGKRYCWRKDHFIMTEEYNFVYTNNTVSNCKANRTERNRQKVSHRGVCLLFFLRFFWTWIIFKVFREFVTTLLLF